MGDGVSLGDTEQDNTHQTDRHNIRIQSVWAQGGSAVFGGVSSRIFGRYGRSAGDCDSPRVHCSAGARGNATPSWWSAVTQSVESSCLLSTCCCRALFCACATEQSTDCEEPMTVALYILGIVSAIVTLGVVVEVWRRRRLRERHALWWLVAGLLALVIGVYPPIVQAAAELIGVQVPANLVYFVSIAILVLVNIQHSAELTSLEAKNRVLAEEIALLDMRLNSLESPSAEISTDTTHA